MRNAWRSLDTLWAEGTLGSLPDGQLLDCFRRDPGPGGQEAFRILVERHGAMVLSVCRGLVDDPHEADDAFQATFLVLVRRADSIRRRETIGPWLHGVACRVARKARARKAIRRKRETTVELDPIAPPESEVSAAEQALQEEIRSLPESLRSPLILCCLEGQSYDLAARRLGLSESTLRGRLHRARKRLEDRLRRRGVLSPIVAGLLEPRWPTLPAALAESTTRFALRWASVDGLLVAAVPGSIANLAQGVINTMAFQTVRACGLAAILTIGAVGTLVSAQQTKTDTKTPPGKNPVGEAARAELPPVDLDLRTRQIREKLDQEIPLDLPEDPQLDQFLKAIKQATTDAKFPGIPIYVDPVGLQEVKAHMGTNVTHFQAGKLGWILRQALRGLHLGYVVKDGFLMITSRTEIIDERLDEIDRKLDRITRALERGQ